MRRLEDSKLNLHGSHLGHNNGWAIGSRVQLLQWGAGQGHKLFFSLSVLDRHTSLGTVGTSAKGCLCQR